MKGALAALLLLAQVAEARPLDLGVRSDFKQEAFPLTTEKMWRIDPEMPNPHRQVWALDREIELSGLQAEGEGVKADGLNVSLKSYLRGPGPWYRSEAEFPCTKSPIPGFGTEEGAKVAVQKAADYWEALLNKRRLQLALKLERIRLPQPEKALGRAQWVFRRWQTELNEAWRDRVYDVARAAEWAYYWKSLGASCKRGKPPVSEVSDWTSRMEPLVLNPPANIFFTRAPAKRWNGMFSVRLGVAAAGKKLNGQFLLDGGSKKSVLAPAWISAQGLNPDFLEVPGAPMQRIDSRFARLVEVDGAELSAYPLPMGQFVLLNVDFFSPPENLDDCCDGVLGQDFMREFAVEFVPDPPVHLKLWAREGFQLGPEAPWVEVSVGKNGDLESTCQAISGKNSVPLTVIWDTGLERGDEKEVSEEGKWSLRCGIVEFPQRFDFKVSVQKKKPKITLGMAFIGKGPFTLDLPHGRLWFSSEWVKKTVPVNRSGLALKFSETPAEGRILTVVRADALKGEGLRAGMKILQVDGVPAEDLDLWEIEQRLAGVYSDTVTLLWAPSNKKSDPLKLVPLRVR